MARVLSISVKWLSISAISVLSSVDLPAAEASYQVFPAPDDAFRGRDIASVNVLDADGMRTERTGPVDEGAFHLDTGRDFTMYYEIVFK